jgi:hypothetical protein
MSCTSWCVAEGCWCTMAGEIERSVRGGRSVNLWPLEPNIKSKILLTWRCGLFSMAWKVARSRRRARDWIGANGQRKGLPMAVLFSAILAAESGRLTCSGIVHRLTLWGDFTFGQPTGAKLSPESKRSLRKDHDPLLQDRNAWIGRHRPCSRHLQDSERRSTPFLGLGPSGRQSAVSRRAVTGR